MFHPILIKSTLFSTQFYSKIDNITGENASQIIFILFFFFLNDLLKKIFRRKIIIQKTVLPSKTFYK